MTDTQLDRALELKKRIKECSDFLRPLKQIKKDSDANIVISGTSISSASLQLDKYPNVIQALTQVMTQYLNDYQNEYKEL